MGDGGIDEILVFIQMTDWLCFTISSLRDKTNFNLFASNSTNNQTLRLTFDGGQCSPSAVQFRTKSFDQKLDQKHLFFGFTTRQKFSAQINFCLISF